MKKVSHTDLLLFGQELLLSSGLQQSSAETTSKTLVEADLMGYSTHGMALLDSYLDSIEGGNMTLSGEPEIVHDAGSTLTWDGKYLPGCWLTHRAIDIALDRVKEHPIVSIAISRSHHIGCLAAYMDRVTQKDLMLVLSCSDPQNNTVAPFGGLNGMYSPNPIAYGIPTNGLPIVMDMSTSTTSNGFIHKTHNQDRKLPHPWLLNAMGEPSDNTEDFFANPPATILPLGGIDTGYKGFGLGLLVEMLTSGLSGHGRADNPQKWGASVYLQLIDPDGFGSGEHLKRQADHFVDYIKSCDPINPGKPVRVPGERAFLHKSKLKEEGILLDSKVISDLQKWATKLDVPSVFIRE